MESLSDRQLRRPFLNYGHDPRPRGGRRRWLGAAKWLAVALFLLAASWGRQNVLADDDYGLEPVSLINRQIEAAWQDGEFKPSPEATSGEWCRRVYLDLLGRIPTVAELQAFLDANDHDRRPALVERLLAKSSADYETEFANNWATIWTNVLVGRTGGTERNSLTSRDGLHQYLRDVFAKNLPYDKMVHELLVATGANRPGDPNYNGATNFLIDKLGDDGVQATAKTAQIFLGMQVQCTQCHNHPFNDWKQNQFWELDAFFRQARAVRTGGRRGGAATLENRDFAGESNDPEEADVFYELRNGLVKVAYPVFIDGVSLVDVHGPQIGNSGFVSDVNRRSDLAKMVVESNELPRAMVNRMWAHFLGYGFTKPIDDMGPHNPPSHPELLDALAEQFRDGYFDMKELMRWIVLSEPYALSSRGTAQNKSDNPQLGGPPRFSRFYMRQMQAEQLYQSLLVATRADRAWGEGSAQGDSARNRWLSQFATAFGTDDNQEATTFNGTIPQTLMMMNGELVRQATGFAEGTMLYDVASDAQRDARQKIEYLYLAALAREPTRDELAQAQRLVALRGGNVGYAMQDIWWVLLNSNEFIMVH